MPGRGEATVCPLTPSVASLIFFHMWKRQKTSPPLFQAHVGLGWIFSGWDHHLYLKWKPLISEMHLARTGSHEGTNPTGLSTKDSDLNIFCVFTCLQDWEAVSFLFFFSHHLNFWSTHAYAFLCDSYGSDMKGWEMWKRPKSAEGR